MQHSSFCVVHSSFRGRYSSSRSSSAGCTFKFSPSILSICHSSFCFQHSTLRIPLASLHCTFNFLNCNFIRWASTAGHRWTSRAQLTRPTPANITIGRLPTGVESGNLLLSQQLFVAPLGSCQPWRIVNRLRLLHSPLRPRLVWVTFEPPCWEWLIAFPLWKNPDLQVSTRTCFLNRTREQTRRRTLTLFAPHAIDR